MKIYTNELGHMTNMATMPIYGKNLKKIFSSISNRLMTLKIGMWHFLCKYYQDCSNYDPGLTLTYFTSKSNLVTWAFVWEKVKIIYLFLFLFFFFLETIAVLGLKVA